MNPCRVLRYEIPVDGATHTVPAPLGKTALVAARNPEVVEVWVEVDERLSNSPVMGPPRHFTVYGTGQSIPDGWHIGSCITAGGALVWHLYESLGNSPRPDAKDDSGSTS